MRSRSFAWVLVALCSLSLGCGRTVVVRFIVDASVPDAGHDAGVDAGVDAGIDAGVDAGVDAGCVPRSFPLTPAVPTVMFVLDRSCSMGDDLNGNRDGGQSRWSVLESSLRSALPSHDQQIAMGALMYPTAGLDSCEPPSSVDRSPALGNTNAILALFMSSPLGGTPTSEAIGVASSHLQTLHTASSAKAVVLATDGAPNCNAALSQSTCPCTQSRIGQPPMCPSSEACLDERRTVSTISDLFTRLQIPTYVVGLGSSLNAFASTLDLMAVAGGVPRISTGHRYYSADSPAELTDAFTRITAQLTRCTYLTTLSPQDTFEVYVGTELVPPGPMGWEWLNKLNGEITLHGTACDRAATGLVATALVTCPP